MMTRYRLGWRGMLAIFAFWTFLAVLTAATRLLDPRGFGFRGSPTGPIIMLFVEYWSWALLTPPILWLGSRYSLERGNWIPRLLLLVGIGLAVAIFMYFLQAFARELIFDPPRPRRAGGFRPGRDIMRFRYVPQLLYYFAILTAGFAREYFLRDRDRQAQAAQLQAQLAEARLDTLRMQVNPHFLFNTLHAISAMVERNPAGVRKMIARLSELLRHTIDSRGADEVPLREELQFLDRYLEIMEIRFQGRLVIERNIAADALEARVPNLILQPIVENALEHGVGRKKGEGLVTLTATRRGDSLVVTVRDNGPGLRDESQSGVGVANTRARLAQLYGDKGSLRLTSGDGDGTLAEISLPWH
jgi:two-component system, LytTR family, sensor kinase